MFQISQTSHFGSFDYDEEYYLFWKQFNQRRYDFEGRFDLPGVGKTAVTQSEPGAPYNSEASKTRQGKNDDNLLYKRFKIQLACILTWAESTWTGGGGGGASGSGGSRRADITPQTTSMRGDSSGNTSSKADTRDRITSALRCP